MRRRDLLIAAPGVTCPALALPAHAATDDATAVTALLDEYQAAWAAADAARMFALATDDIHWINIMGMHWRGKADVQEAHRVYLEGIFRNVPMTLQAVESMTPVGADVLAVVARWEVGAFTAPSGAVFPTSLNRMSLILQRTPDGLRIAHVANIEVNQAAQRADPINRPDTAPRG